MKLRALHSIPGIQVHFADDDRCIASRGLNIVRSDDRGVNWREFCRLPSGPANAALQRVGLYQRLVRGGVNTIAPFESYAAENWVAIAAGKLYLLQPDAKYGQPFWSISRGRRPLRRGMSTLGQQIFVGEYFSNPERDDVHIYRLTLDPNGTEAKTESLYCFPAGSIRHVHTVDPDPHSGKLWVSTGDEDAECRIMILDPQSGTAEIVGQGGQMWRSVSFAFRPEAVYWGSDDPLGANQIWRYDRATKQTTAIGEVKGPVYYNACLQDYIVFATTVEDGDGHQDGYGRLYGVNLLNPRAGLDVVELLKRPKDHWHSRYFGYGLFEFAEGRAHGNNFWVTAKGFRGGLSSTLFEILE